MRNEAPQGKAEWVDLTEPVEDWLKIICIAFIAALLLVIWLSWGYAEGLNARLAREEALNAELRAKSAETGGRIKYLQGKCDTLDPVFDWWFSLMHGRMAEKRMRAFRNIDFILRYVSI